MNIEMESIPKNYSPYLTLDKYPEFMKYIISDNGLSHSIFCKCLILVLYFRQKLKYPVETDEAFYGYIEKVPHSIFENMNEADYKELLQCVVCLAITTIVDESDIDTDDKLTIIKSTVQYNVP